MHELYCCRFHQLFTNNPDTLFQHIRTRLETPELPAGLMLTDTALDIHIYKPALLL